MRRASFGLALALVSAFASLTVQAESDPELGRLFYTPERRAALERQRQSNIREAQTLAGGNLSLDGVVAGSSGRTTIWVNGRAATERDAGLQAEVRRSSPGRATLSAGDEDTLQLRVGDVVNRATGERDDRLGGGIVVTPTRR